MRRTNCIGSAAHTVAKRFQRHPILALFRTFLFTVVMFAIDVPVVVVETTTTITRIARRRRRRRQRLASGERASKML